MHRARQSIPTVFLLLLLCASPALAGDHSDCLSVPAKDMIVRVVSMLIRLAQACEE